MTRPETDEVLRWLFARQRFGARLGLERMRRLMQALGEPQATYRCALVAGTNGKGSTAAVLAAALQRGGAHVGLTTSPHLQRLSERVAVDGRPVGEGMLAGALRRIRPQAERLGATFFEVVTAAALLLFADAGVDAAVLEVGLGGRFDATNVVEPALSLVTGVSLDHTAVLGGSLRDIAREKAGILRPGVPAWTAAEGEALAELELAAEALGVQLRALEREGGGVAVRDLGWEGLEVSLKLSGQPLIVRSPLVGAHQARNVALALVGAAELGVSPAASSAAAGDTRWPGRLERLPFRGGWLVLDGAHNPEAARALARALGSLEGRVAAMILGVSADKDVAGVVDALAPAAERLIVTRAAWSPRALSPEALARVAPTATPLPSLGEALARGRAWAGAGGTLVVAGSLFLVGEARALALGESAEGRERWQ